MMPTGEDSVGEVVRRKSEPLEEGPKREAANVRCSCWTVGFVSVLISISVMRSRMK
jgi:hypothetical protein